jgi:hypothetical protein
MKGLPEGGKKKKDFLYAAIVEISGAVSTPIQVSWIAGVNPGNRKLLGVIRSGGLYQQWLVFWVRS